MFWWKRVRITKVQGLKDHPLNKGRLCPKGARAIELVYHPDRLKYPLKKVNGEWKRISWDIALTEIADKLQSLKKEFGPESAEHLQRFHRSRKP